MEAGPNSTALGYLNCSFTILPSTQEIIQVPEKEW